MKKLLFAFLFLSLTLVGFSQSPSNESIENTVRRLDSLEKVSFLNSDLAALDTLWAADMVVNNPRNTISRGSAETRELLKKGIIKHNGFERYIEHLVVKNDSMVIIMGHEVMQDKPGDPTYKRRFTDIWLKQGNSWKMSVRHANKILEK